MGAAPTASAFVTLPNWAPNNWPANTFTALTRALVSGFYVATATTTTANSVEVGETFTVSGCTPSAYNGTWTALAGTTGSTLVWSLLTETDPGAETVLGELNANTSGQGPWTANILRASNSALCAYGITMNGTYSPTMVLTSEFALEDVVPVTWDFTLGTNNATQNVLSEMQGPITDACALGNVMVIFGQNETWVQYLSGDDNIWDYQPLFSDAGAISTNCAVEVDKKQYVFGLNDLWVHDGVSKQSICDERTREFIFASINVTEASRCSVTYNRNLKELYFRYLSGDEYCYFAGADGCNRQAVFHIPTNTWSFDDLPFVFGATMANLDTIWTWTTVPGTWASIGGTWFSQTDSAKQVMVMIGDVNSTFNLTESVYAFDLEGPGSLVSYPVDTNATQGWTLIRDGLDLHEIGNNLRSYDLISSIYPQFRLEANAEPISFSFGSADYFNENVVMSVPQTYDGDTLYKLDYNAAGRYLFMEITHDDYHWVQGSSIDFDVDVTGDW